MTPEPNLTAPASTGGPVVDGPEPASTTSASSLELCQRVAHEAASQAGVSVRSVGDLDELKAVAGLCAEIWQGGAEAPLTTELLRALDKAGNYVVGAFDHTGLVGACVGFFGSPGARILHSHIAGVAPAMRRQNVGFAIKVHQRAWAMQRDVKLVEWTYDPLVARNAHVNLTKLGALPVEYLPNFYGGMHDVINGGDDTDRLLVHWLLDSPAVEAAASAHPRARNATTERARGAVEVLGVSPRGAPVAGQEEGDVSLVAVPTDIERLRVSDPLLAREWRVAVRETLVGLLAGGSRITGFDQSGWYVAER